MLEVDVQGETASAISMAHDSNWSLPYLEEQIKQHKGDVNAIFYEVCQPCYQKLHPMRIHERLFSNQKRGCTPQAENALARTLKTNC